MMKKKSALEIAYSKVNFKVYPSKDKYPAESLCPEKLAYANKILSKIPDLTERLDALDESKLKKS